jgi:hypothetical protein
VTSVEIFNQDNLPGRRLRVKTTHASYGSTELGRQMVVARERMAQRIAQLICEEPDLFKVHGGGGFFVEQSADVVVLTQDELAEFARSKFKAGIDYASGFFRVPPEQGNGN